MIKRILLVLTAAPVAWPQVNGAIEGPVLGLVFDGAAAAVRTIAGVPGAATLGPAVTGGARLRTAAAAANRGYALAIDGDGAAMLVSADGVRPLPGASAGAERAIVSPRGTSAALVHRSGTVQVFTGMPEAPSAGRIFELRGAPPTLALSDDGDALLAVVRGRPRADASADAVYLYTDGEPAVLHRGSRVAAAAFLPGSKKALIAGSSAARIVAPDLGESPAGIDPDGDIVAVAGSPDGSRVFLAGRSGRIAIYDLRSGESVSVACACSPTGFAPLRGNSVFRLNEAGGGPVWVLDADSSEPRISFVAAAGGER
jgi:hypothetical protein